MNTTKQTYQGAIKRSPFAYSALIENMSQHAKRTTEMTMTADEAKFIESLRGHRGYTAKRKAFDYAIANMGRTYDELIGMFPDCNSKK